MTLLSFSEPEGCSHSSDVKHGSLQLVIGGVRMMLNFFFVSSAVSLIYF